MNTAEEFKPVIGYDGIYEVSNIGRVRSVDRMSCGGRFGNYFVSGKLIKTSIDPLNGYRYMTLAKGKHKLKVNVHRLVARAFIGEDNNMVVDHKNGDRGDNRAENLEYVTMRENISRGRKCEKRENKKCKSRGVTKSKWNRYISSIRLNGKAIYLGSYGTEIEAAEAYNSACLELRSENK